MQVRVAGLDGCQAGWIMVTAPVEGKGSSTVEVVRDLASVFARIDSGELVAAAIDIPIGLPDSEPRRCDIEARKLIGPRRSSVFPTPYRQVLAADTYEEAAVLSVDASGKGISKQAFGILPKIREVDDLITPARQDSFVEVHPEVCFTVLAGAPMTWPKRTPDGRQERLHALRTAFSDVDAISGRRISGSQDDDILDAFAAAWSARNWMTNSYQRLGGDLDSRGLRMEMIA